MNNRFYEILSSLSDAVAQKTYDGKKRSELKDSDFLFPATKSFPIVTPQDVKDAISNFGRMKGSMSYETFLRKLYNFCKRKGPEFVAALPEASKDKLNLKSQSTKKPINADDNDDTDNSPINYTGILNNMEDDFPNPIDEDVMEGKCQYNSMAEEDEEALNMAILSLKSAFHHIHSIFTESLKKPEILEDLTEPWIQAKIAIVNDYVAAIHDFLMYSEESDDTSEGGAKPGLWDNIRKKKEREGKNYKPAKPGDKDRPDPEQWKKLTKPDK